MATLTFQIVDGFEKGQILSDLNTPVTIGREEDNTIQLNDDRVSRFHVKIHEEQTRIILMDLDSTNGTRVNGHPVQMRVLQVGDVISVGRYVLLYGSPDQISERRRVMSAKGVDGDASRTMSIDVGYEEALFPSGPPEIPEGLRPVQLAELSDVLGYLHEQMNRIVQSGCEDLGQARGEVRVPWDVWQSLIDLEIQVAKYQRRIANQE